ncbi:hypothetical protein [Streptomyces virginiae]|uniref:hypothetical protein n=1 Tax=Streptomyces virginiae TaxID=1961 RepID=UPI0035DA81C6
MTVDVAARHPPEHQRRVPNALFEADGSRLLDDVGGVQPPLRAGAGGVAEPLGRRVDVEEFLKLLGASASRCARRSGVAAGMSLTNLRRSSVFVAAIVSARF